jgi:type I restriction enzyme S subunit
MKTRLDWVAPEVRDTIQPSELGMDVVFHYSIPVFDEIGDGAFEDPAEIGSGKTLLRGGEVLVSKLNPRKQRVLVAPQHEVPTVCSGEFVALRPVGIDPGYLVYRFLAEDTRQMLDSRVQSVTRSHQRVRPDDIAKMWMDLPSSNEQRAIADYLDAETARIDALVAKKRCIVELLEAQFRARQVSILTGSHAVERVGHAILGSIPAHWEVRRAKHCTAGITVGVVVNPSSYFVDEGVPFIHGTDVREGKIDETSMKFLSVESNLALAKSIVRSGDVVAMRVGYPGRASVVPRALDGSNCASVLIFRQSPILAPDILMEFLNSPLGRLQIESVQYGAAQGVMNVSDAVDLNVPVPPHDEQQDVSCALRKARDHWRATSSAIERQVAVIAEHREALITAAVTGELDIPGVAA